MKRLLLLVAALSVAFAAPPAECAWAAPIEEESRGSRSLDLMVDDVGISFGNSKRVRGLRFNVRDEGVEEVIGLNFTLWKPGENPDAVMKGLLFGIYGPAADELHFLSIGLAAVEAHSLISGIAIGGGTVVCEGIFSGISIGGLANVVGSMNGIALGGLANVSDGFVNGITIGGLANVAEGRVSGITVGGLANVAEDDMTGISLGGLANVAEGDMTGISLGGLANVAEGDMTGISLGGLANVSEGEMMGISLGGLANVAEGEMTGISLGGLANVSEGEMMGISLGGLANVSEGEMMGISLGGLANVSEGEMVGISLGGLAVVSEPGMSGISLGGLAVVSEEGPVAGLNVGGIMVGSKGPVSGLTLSLGGIYAGDLTGLTVGVIGVLEFPSITIESTYGGDSGGFGDAYKRISYTGISARNARWLTLHGIDIDIDEELLGFAASGIRIHAETIKGFASSLVVTTGEMHGLGIAAVNYSSDFQVGLSIGIVNYTERLKGIQLGLINIAKNKPKPFRVMPILNACFD